MDKWKIATLVLVILLLRCITVSVALVSNANKRASNALSELREYETQAEHAHSAANITKGFLNFFKINGYDTFDADDYERQIKRLNSFYLHEFPEWATIKSDTTDWKTDINTIAE